MFAGGTCGRPRARYHLDFWFPVQTSLKIGFEPPQRQARISLSAVSSVVYLYSPYVLIVLVSRYASESYFDYIHRPPPRFSGGVRSPLVYCICMQGRQLSYPDLPRNRLLWSWTPCLRFLEKDLGREQDDDIVLEDGDPRSSSLEDSAIHSTEQRPREIAKERKNVRSKYERTD